jgi:hypothetical protein
MGKPSYSSLKSIVAQMHSYRGFQLNQIRCFSILFNNFVFYDLPFTKSFTMKESARLSLKCQIKFFYNLLPQIENF